MAQIFDKICDVFINARPDIELSDEGKRAKLSRMTHVIVQAAIRVSRASGGTKTGRSELSSERAPTRDSASATTFC